MYLCPHYREICCVYLGANYPEICVCVSSNTQSYLGANHSEICTFVYLGAHHPEICVCVYLGAQNPGYICSIWLYSEFLWQAYLNLINAL